MSFATNWVHTWFFLVGSVLRIFLVLCGFAFCFVGLRPMSCVPNVASVSGESICLKLISFLIMSV